MFLHDEPNTVVFDQANSSIEEVLTCIERHKVANVDCIEIHGMKCSSETAELICETFGNFSKNNGVKTTLRLIDTVVSEDFMSSLSTNGNVSTLEISYVSPDGYWSDIFGMFDYPFKNVPGLLCLRLMSCYTLEMFTRLNKLEKLILDGVFENEIPYFDVVLKNNPLKELVLKNCFLKPNMNYMLSSSTVEQLSVGFLTNTVTQMIDFPNLRLITLKYLDFTDANIEDINHTVSFLLKIPEVKTDNGYLFVKSNFDWSSEIDSHVVNQVSYLLPRVGHIVFV